MHQGEHEHQLFTGMPIEDADAFDGEFGFIQADTGFNGLITNDKFCMVRTVQLQLNHWRRPLRMRTPDTKQMVYSASEKSDFGGSHETKMEDPSGGTEGSKRAGSLGSSLSSDLGDSSHSGCRPGSTESGGEPCE